MNAAFTTLKIRNMEMSDLPFCRQLVSQAGWNQLDADWVRAMSLEPEGCFVGEMERAVATTTTCCFGDCGWIAMVLVDLSHRNRGIARSMLHHAIQYLEEKGMRTIRLDATSLGQPLYRQLGFVEEYEVIRFMREKQPEKPVLWQERTSVTRDTQKKIISLDTVITGTNRATLLENMFLSHPKPVFVVDPEIESALAGFGMSRAGIHAVQLGPAIALNAVTGAFILSELLSENQHHRTFIDIPAANKGALRWAEKNQFIRQRNFIRMYRGEAVRDAPEMIWASFGPEKG